MTKARTRSAALIVFIAIFLLCSRAASALCLGITLSNLPVAATFAGASGEYSVFDPTQYAQNVAFKVNGTATVGGCRYYITMDAGSSGNAAQRKMTRGADTLDYNAYADSGLGNVMNSAGTYGTANVISGIFPYLLGVAQTNDETLYWTIAPQQVVAAGAARFQDATVAVRVWAELALGLFTNTDTATITFQGTAESDVDLSLVDSGGAFALSDTAQTVDFGDLSSGESLAYDTLIRSNDGYRVTLQSQNGQVLRHSTYPAVTTTIPYSVEFNGAALDLTAGTGITAIAAGGTTPLTGARFPTRFTIGTLSGAEPAGNYQDILTVTVSAN